MERHALPHKKPRSAAEDLKLIDRFIVPALGSRKAPTVTRDDVERLHRSLRATPYQANRVLACLSAVFNRAELDLRNLAPGWANPCRKVKRFAEEKRRRYLSSAELAALGRALSVAEAEGIAAPEAVAAIRLLIFTGCRRWEILSLPWTAVYFEGRRLRLEDSKSIATMES